MPYLIDGHNLVPHLGLSLAAVDDEDQLIHLLQEFCRLARKQAEVYFDDAPAGQPASRKFGAVTAHYVRPPREADDALAARLEKLGGAAKNWTVVSSDGRVQAAAREARARVIAADAFARLVRETLSAGAKKSTDQPAGMSADELAEWLDIFNK